MEFTCRVTIFEMTIVYQPAGRVDLMPDPLSPALLILLVHGILPHEGPGKNSEQDNYE